MGRSTYNERQSRDRTKHETNNKSSSSSRPQSSSRFRYHSPNRYSRGTKRHRRAPSQWDIPPVGYEHITPLQYKEMQANGQIASRIVPDILQPAASAAVAMVTRQARRLYVGNIPFGITGEDMINFFNQQLLKLNHYSDGSAVLSCQVNLEKNFAFLEFRSMDEASMAMDFDGHLFHGQTLKIRRPHDYHSVSNVNTSTTVTTTSISNKLSDNHIISPLVPDSPQKIYIGGLPVCLNEDQIKELLLSFGNLRGFNLVRDTITGGSKGFAFCEYIDSEHTDQAIAGLNGMSLGDRKLIVQRSIAGSRNNNNLPNVPTVVQVPGLPSVLTSGKPTTVLCLLNIVQPEELIDDEEYEDIRRDIKQECFKFGRVRSLQIPRPKHDQDGGNYNRVYVQFESTDDCQRAQKALSGRKFSGRVVVTSFYDPEKYLCQKFP